jgi:hypothetical protein
MTDGAIPCLEALKVAVLIGATEVVLGASRGR